MLKVTDDLLLHAEQEVVVLLLFLGGIHEEGPHHIGAVGFIPHTERAGDGAKMELVLVTVIIENKHQYVEGSLSSIITIIVVASHTALISVPL